MPCPRGGVLLLSVARAIADLAVCELLCGMLAAAECVPLSELSDLSAPHRAECVPSPTLLRVSCCVGCSLSDRAKSLSRLELSSLALRWATASVRSDAECTEVLT